MGGMEGMPRLLLISRHVRSRTPVRRSWSAHFVPASLRYCQSLSPDESIVESSGVLSPILRADLGQNASFESSGEEDR
jgi:hypothetical protein